MRLLALAAALLAPLSAHAFVAFTNSNFNGITAGQPFELTWQGDGTPVTITLEAGQIGNLQPVQTIATSARGPSYSWTSPSNTAPGTYALQISQGGYTNYSPQFTIAGGPSPSTTTQPSTTPSSTPAETFASNPTTPYSYTVLPTDATAAPTTPDQNPDVPSDSLPEEDLASSPPTTPLAEQPPYPYTNGNSTPTYIIASASGGILYPSGTGYMGNGTLIFAGGASGRVGGGGVMGVVGAAFLAGGLVLGVGTGL